MKQLTDHPGLHRAAWAVLLTTFPLIFVGGLVTSKGVGMSVPDWPNSYGYNMWLFPPSKWVGGVFWEHLHRLKGTLVGLCAVILALQAWGPSASTVWRRRWGRVAVGLLVGSVVSLGVKLVWPATFGLMQHVFTGLLGLAIVASIAWASRRPEPRRWVRWLCTGVLVAVIVQGTLGGLRVTEVSLTLAIIHGCFAQAFFCLAGLTVLVTSRWWKTRSWEVGLAPVRASRLATFASVCVALLFVQLILGAVMRHHGAGLAIPDLPLHYGQLLPPTDQASLAAANRIRSGGPELLAPVTLWQIWLHFSHRAGAVVVSVAMIWMLVSAWKARAGGLRPLSATLMALLVTQFTLGVLTVYFRKPADLASAHVAGGALLLMGTTLLAARVWRLGWVNRRRPINASRRVEVPKPMVLVGA